MRQGSGRVLLLILGICTACSPSTGKAPVPDAVGTASPTAPPPTATPPPSPSPPPTATLGPAPRTFQEDFDGGAPYWQFMQVDIGSPLPSPQPFGGFLTFDLRDPNLWVYELYDSVKYSDVRIDAAFEFQTGAQGSAGVICRYDNARGWYEFDVFPDQTYVLLLGQWLKPGVVRYTPLVQTSSEKIRPDQNEIGLACEGDILTPYINGTQMRRRQETLYKLEKGQVGFSAASFDNPPVGIAYDWIRVGSP